MKPPLAPWKRAARSGALILGLVVVLFGGGIRLFEESFIYFPTKGAMGPSPGEEIALVSSDGVRIHGWFVRHPEAKVSVLLFHGNAGNLEHRRSMVLQLRESPANVLAIDYRGYGK